MIGVDFNYIPIKLKKIYIRRESLANIEKEFKYVRNVTITNYGLRKYIQNNLLLYHKLNQFDSLTNYNHTHYFIYDFYKYNVLISNTSHILFKTLFEIKNFKRLTLIFYTPSVS